MKESAGPVPVRLNADRTAQDGEQDGRQTNDAPETTVDLSELRADDAVGLFQGGGKRALTTRRLEQEYDRRPTPEEIAQEMGLKPQRVRWMLKISRYPLSLERPVGQERNEELGAFIEDESTPEPPELAQRRLLRDQLEKVLATLTAREAGILRLRFGLQDGRMYTLEEIGQRFGLTRERIRQIEHKALRRLRHPRRSRRLRSFLGE